MENINNCFTVESDVAICKTISGLLKFRHIRLSEYVCLR